MLVKLALYLGSLCSKEGCFHMYLGLACWSNKLFTLAVSPQKRAAYICIWLLLLNMLVKLAVYLGSLCSKEGCLQIYLVLPA
jgi:hypothetical protein